MRNLLEIARELVAAIEAQENENNVKQIALGDLQPGDRFNSELGKFIVLDHDVNSGCTKVILDNFLEEDVQFDEGTCDYTKSALREKFDGEITEKFETVFGEHLVEHEVSLVSVDMQDYGKFNCKVRPITFDEAREFNSLIVKKELPDYWWTCTPWSTEERGWKYSVTVVYPSGCIGRYDCGNDGGVRPVCILKSNLFVSKVEA